MCIFVTSDADHDSLVVGGVPTVVLWIIVGVAGGLLVVVLVVTAAAILCCRRRRRSTLNKQRFNLYTSTGKYSEMTYDAYNK